MAIFVLALLFLALFLFIMKRTRLGLEVRAVTQNPGMAASAWGSTPTGSHADLRPWLGHRRASRASPSGFSRKVTSELGQDYIVQIAS